MKYLLILVLLAACAAKTSLPIESIRSASTVACTPLAPSGGDDRLAIQAADSACHAAGLPLQWGAGTYLVASPVKPRPKGMLIQTASWVGIPGQTVLQFSGDNGGLDWIGIWPQAAGVSITNMVIASSFAGGSTTEQTHLIHIDGLSGPLSGIHLSYLTLTNPIDRSASPTRIGDCIQLVGYEPQADGSHDERLTSIEIDHVTFTQCARSGIGWPGGLHASRFHDNLFEDTNDQDMDGEIGGGGSSEVEIDHNTLLIGPDTTSAIAVQIQAASAIHFHDNTIHGRGINVQTCAGCEFDHDVIDQIDALGNYGVIDISKLSPGISIHDESLTRAASAGSGPVVRAVQSPSGAPSAVTVADSMLTQHATASVVIGYGIVGFHVLRPVISYDGPAGFFAFDAVGGPGATGIRTTDIDLWDAVITGTFVAPLRVSGSYAGTGTADVERSGSQAVRCENVTTGGTIIGPVTQDGRQVCP